MKPDAMKLFTRNISTDIPYQMPGQSHPSIYAICLDLRTHPVVQNNYTPACQNLDLLSVGHGFDFLPSLLRHVGLCLCGAI